MNSLNSVMVEGKVIDEIIELKKTVKGMSFVEFSIRQQRKRKNDDDQWEAIEYPLPVLIYADLAEKMYKAGLVGKDVRIVGRLGYFKEAKHTIKIIAEYIETKPVGGK